MARKVKCPYCEEYFDRAEHAFEYVSKRYYHKVCYEKVLQKKKESKKKSEASSKDPLDEYICKLFNTSYVNPRVKQQINNMVRDYKFSTTGILKTLIYFYEIREGNIHKANGGIGIVPYVYEDAKKYFLRVYMAQKSNEDKNISEMVGKGETIKIAPPKRRPKKIKLFNLEEDVEYEDKV